VRGGFGTREHDFKPRLFPCGIPAWGDDDGKELGNSLNCKSNLLNPRRLSLTWEKKKRQQPSSGPPPKMLPKTWPISESCSKRRIDTQRVYGFKSSSMELCNGVIMLFFGFIQSFMPSIALSLSLSLSLSLYIYIYIYNYYLGSALLILFIFNVFIRFSIIHHYLCQYQI
jgi:hypothetical protein